MVDIQNLPNKQTDCVDPKDSIIENVSFGLALTTFFTTYFLVIFKNDIIRTRSHAQCNLIHINTHNHHIGIFGSSPRQEF